ncbi:MAG: Zn-ribbon domain-containing OB-fold protein [Elusimicrobia bacterium]|nr:Zn-ribbon domain-containing OB-fold protein [Elusimicrobiota bacterium]
MIGTTARREEIVSRKVLTFTDEPKAHYAWDCGEAMGRYLQELKKGKLIARKCHKCQRVMIPPRIFCEKCFRDTDEWVYVKDTGRVNTFSVCFVTWDMKRIKKPQIPSVIEIDGASKGMGFLHMIHCPDWKKVHVGMKVKAVWKPKGKRQGAITDILYWVPI